MGQPVTKVYNQTLAYLHCFRRDTAAMGGEIFSTSILLFTLVLVGLGAGFLLLRLQGGEE
ncbi:MAG TPA: PetM family cytochrome b6-f complex subunit 7 [Leptolyngbyaceae cyanobacterium]